jgi:putative metal-binding protein
MRTLPGWVLLSLSSGVLLIACGRSSLSLGSGGADSGAGGSSSATTAAATTSGVTTAVSSSSATTGAGGGPTCTPEICDGLDNDCNGLVDEGCQCTPGSIGTCYSGPPETLNVGVCKQGQHVCNPDGLGYGACTGEVTPGAEICNGLDDDCDNGLVDEGCVTTGCSDGTREGFLDAVKYPKIAGCSGGFSVPGIVTAIGPECAFSAGNSGNNPKGVGCTVADLCAPGFHVCKSAADVKASSPTGCDGAAPVPGLFFATRQSSTGCELCALGDNVNPAVCNGCSCAQDCQQTSLTANDLFGCGSLGATVDTCGVLDRTSNDLCESLGPPWNCDSAAGGCAEATVVTKSASAGGGVLCCAD